MKAELFTVGKLLVSGICVMQRSYLFRIREDEVRCFLGRTGEHCLEDAGLLDRCKECHVMPSEKKKSPEDCAGGTVRDLHASAGRIVRTVGLHAIPNRWVAHVIFGNEP